MPTSSGNYESPQPPGPVVTVTDNGGGDQRITILVTLKWDPAAVVVGTPTPRAGSIIDKAAGWCEWNKRTGLGTKKFKIRMRSNGPTSNVYASIVIVKNGGVWTNDHTIVIPAAAPSAKTKKPKRKA